MKSIFLYTRQDLPLNLEKINLCLYYDTKTDHFYRLNVMPQCTVFASEDVEERQMMALTRFDPVFYMIQMLLDNKAVNSEDFPQFFKKRNWNLLAQEKNNQGKICYVLDRQKVFDFLQKKVQIIEKFLDDNNPLDRLKLIKLEPKSISSDTISLLKNEINENFVAEFVKERYNQQASRKILPSIEEPQATKPKPQGKNNKKSQTKKQQSIPKNQQTLFGWAKK